MFVCVTLIDFIDLDPVTCRSTVRASAQKGNHIKEGVGIMPAFMSSLYFSMGVQSHLWLTFLVLNTIEKVLNNDKWDNQIN